MAMIRNSLRKLAAFPLLAVSKRTAVEYFDAWHRHDRNVEVGADYKAYIKDLWHRRAVLGPDEVQPRSKQLLWNYDAELFAFGKRLGEDFRLPTLRRAFLHSSYTSVKKKPEAADAEGENAPSTSNDDLISIGEELINIYVNAYLRCHFPKLPEEGIRTIARYLTSEEQLAYLANNLGMFDLTLAADFPYGDPTMANTFKAVVGGLKEDSGEQKAEYFVQDFVLTELIDLDVNEIFYVKNPTRILTAVLEKSGRGTPEPRILRQVGTFTVTPTYLIGIYVDKQLLGQAPGESIQIAEEMAARDCLKTLWDIHPERRLPLTFGQKAGRALKLDLFKTRENESLRSIIDFGDEANLLDSAFEEEPFDLDEMYQKYKEEIEPAFGRVYRRHFKHAFYSGSVNRRNPRPFIAPNVKWI